MSSSHTSSSSSSSPSTVSTSSPGQTAVSPSDMLSTLGSNNQGWLQELQGLGYMPNSGQWGNVGAANGSTSGVPNATAGGLIPVSAQLQQNAVSANPTANPSLLQLMINTQNAQAAGKS